MATLTNASEKERITAEKLDALRQQMAAHQLDAYLIPSVDEHINEYLPENKQRRAWASGFTGSAGDFLLAKDEAWVFVDSRYHEQADYEVALNHVHVSKLGLSRQPGVSEKIRQLAENQEQFRLGFDPFTLTVQQAQAFEKAFDTTGIALVPVSGNLVDPLWKDAPADINSEVFAIPESIAGQSWQEKLKQVQEKLKAARTGILPITKLDQIAWLFNLRGRDIPYNPVFIAYAIVTTEQAHLFINAARVRPEDLEALSTQVGVHPYEAYAPTLQQLAANQTVLLDPKHTTYGTLTLIQQGQGRIKEADHPVELMKAVKNDTEIHLMQDANLKASRGKIRAWYWLEQQISTATTVTEESFKDKIEQFYAEEEGFMGLSFNTISGAGTNSSIVHYGTPDPDKKLELGELFLIDSGCQFMGGTTDDTRTMLVGNTPT
jgi:Xaa-Pro aminopeptidase